MYKLSNKVGVSCLAALFILDAGGTAWSAEAVLPAGQIGGSDIRSAALPPTGLYGGLFILGGDLPGLFGPEGSVAHADGSHLIVGAGVRYVYPWEIFGGRIASGLTLSYQQTCFGDYVRGGVTADVTCANGLRDAYTDLLLWSRFFPSAEYFEQPDKPGKMPYGLSIMLGFGMNLPIGSYVKGRAVNTSANFWNFAPQAGFTYTTKSLLGDYFGQATEFSAKVYLNNFTENPSTNYQTGTMVSWDAAITQRQNQWQYGIAFYSFHQIEDDQLNGVPVDFPGGVHGRKAWEITGGPIVAYDTMIDNHPWQFAVKGLFALCGANTSYGNVALVRAVTKF